MPEVTRNKGESFESLLRQYTQKIRESGRMLEMKKRRAYNPGKSKLEQKKKATRCKTIDHQLAYWRKIGKINDATPQDVIKKYIRKIK